MFSLPVAAPSPCYHDPRLAGSVSRAPNPLAGMYYSQRSPPSTVQHVLFLSEGLTCQCAYAVLQLGRAAVPLSSVFLTQRIWPIMGGGCFDLGLVGRGGLSMLVPLPHRILSQMLQ